MVVFGHLLELGKKFFPHLLLFVVNNPIVLVTKMVELERKLFENGDEKNSSLFLYNGRGNDFSS